MSARVIEYSTEQHAALDAIRDWLDAPDRNEFVLGGLAGTGKTTIVREVVARCGCEGAVLAFTGKAAYVLRTKGVEGARTLHSYIYTTSDACIDCRRAPELCADANLYWSAEALHQRRRGDSDAETEARKKICPATGTRARYQLVPSIRADLVIVDEASMLTRRIVEDLRSFNKKILFVGDHGQLEPIGADARIMATPDLRLEAIHRQAAHSPVVHFAHAVRVGVDPRDIEVVAGNEHGLCVRRGLPSNDELVGSFDMILCGLNETRRAVNRRIRRLLGHEGRTPRPGEQVICLRNLAKKGLFNGMLARVEEADGSRISLTSEDGRQIERLPYVDEQFGAAELVRDAERDDGLFDYGYAITVHKSQGSEWNRVCVLEQLAPSWSASRWRYTAATRAAKHLTWCTSSEDLR